MQAASDVIDALAEKAIRNPKALQDLMMVLNPAIKALASRQASYDGTNVVEFDDYVQIGNETILTCLQKWSKTGFQNYVLRTAKLRMKEYRLLSWQPFSASKRVQTVSAVKFRLENALNREPTADEIYWAIRNKGTRQTQSIESIVAALEALQPTRHLDFADILTDEDVPVALTYDDDYFQTETQDEEDDILTLKDEALIVAWQGATPYQKRVISTWMDSEGDWETFQQTMGYSTLSQAKDSWHTAMKSIGKLDSNSSPVRKRIELAKELDRMRNNPALLDRFGLKTKAYLKDTISGMKVNEIAEKHKTTRATVGASIDDSVRKIRKWAEQENQ